MFVKVIRGEVQSIYQCENVRIVRQDGGVVMVDMEPSNISLKLQRTPGGTSLYLMNDSGATVERYIVLPPDDPE